MSRGSVIGSPRAAGRTRHSAASSAAAGVLRRTAAVSMCANPACVRPVARRASPCASRPPARTEACPARSATYAPSASSVPASLRPQSHPHHLRSELERLGGIPEQQGAHQGRGVGVEPLAKRLLEDLGEVDLDGALFGGGEPAQALQRESGGFRSAPPDLEPREVLEHGSERAVLARRILQSLLGLVERVSHQRTAVEELIRVQQSRVTVLRRTADRVFVKLEPPLPERLEASTQQPLVCLAQLVPVLRPEPAQIHAGIRVGQPSLHIVETPPGARERGVGLHRRQIMALRRKPGILLPRLLAPQELPQRRQASGRPLPRAAVPVRKVWVQPTQDLERGGVTEGDLIAAGSPDHDLGVGRAGARVGRYAQLE